MLDLLLPSGCVVCRGWVPGGRTAPLVCAPCRSRLRRASWPRCPRCHAPRGTGRDSSAACFECRPWPDELARARFAYLLVPPATDLAHALKYEGWRELAVPMGEAMAEATPDDFRADAVVVPIPTTEARMRERGYNQAAVLASVVADRLGLTRVDLLRRIRAPASQTTLTPEARRANVAGAFALLPGRSSALRDRRVLLVDDVLTTGATVASAAATLIDGGAADLCAVTFGRALPNAPEERAA